MLVLFIIFFLSTIYFQSEKRLWYFIGALFVGGLFLALFELINIFIGFDKILPGFLQGISAGNLVGSWSNFALLFGIMVLLALFTIELLRTTKVIYKVAEYALLSLGILFLILVNVPLVWLLVGLFSVIIFVYSISLQHSGVKVIQGDNNKKKFPFASLIVIFVSLMFLIGGNLVSNIISKYVNLNNPDIRPSIVTTSQIALKSIMHNPAFGTGPNTFVIDWALWQPKEIAQTIFWNVDFSNGFSLLTTFAVTTGILGLAVLIAFLVFYAMRGIKSIKIALESNLFNYFIMTTLMISVYSWITVIIYNPNIIMLMLAFSSSGILIGILVQKQVIPVKDFSFLSDPRNSFFSILILLVLMVSAVSLTYVYVEKFTSIMYFSKGLKGDTTMESLSKSESMMLKAIALDKNDVYYRNLSQVYVNQINALINNKEISEDTLKSELQQLINLAQQQAGLAVSQNPKQYLNYVNLGNVYSALVPLSVANSYESAITAYDKASLLAPNNPSIILAKGSLAFVKKDNTEARKFIKQAIELKANYIDAIFLLVQIETNEGNLSEAIKQAQYAGELAPNDPTVFFRLGLLRYNNNDYNGSISAFEKAVILDNSYLNARFFLGQAYKKVGRTNDALTQFNILNTLVPDNQEIKTAISSINQPSQDNKTTEKDTAKNKKQDVKVKPPLEEKQ
jgi:cytochrome c-type biogenesis protein CcmH/NrfG